MTAAEAAPLTSMASAIFFGSVMFAAVALTFKSAASGDWRAVQAAKNPRSSPLDPRSFTSIYTFLVHMSILGCILLYAYICEYHPPFPHAQKSYDRDEFFFYTALLFVASAFTLKSHDSTPASTPTSSTRELSNGKHVTLLQQNSSSFTMERPVAPPDEETEVMNRDQTEEWKGWMQFMFLLYHYYSAEEIYNAIRVMITCYVFLTGYGNVSFFYLKRDYSAIRVIQMLWRLNFLVMFLCLTQGTTYILYYICLLHTYFFLMVYLTMLVSNKEVNYTKYGIRFKFGILALIIFIVWDLDSGIFRLMHALFLGETPMLGATSGAMWEWYFRSSLDHWSTYLGMLFALNFPITSLFFRKLEARPLPLVIAVKGVMALSFLGATYWWVTGPFQLAKFDYNQTNAYFAWIPLISYIYLRNMTQWLRGHSLELLHQIGKTTLETYLMQHHIWLTSNAKSILTLIPGWPKMNFLVVTIVYFFFSRKLYTLTLFLRGMVLPNDLAACARNLSFLLGSLFASVCLAYLLRLCHALNLISVAACSFVFGSIIVKTVVDQTWSAFAQPASPAAGSSTAGKSQTNSSLHPLGLWLGALAVLFLGTGWHSMATVGAGKIRPLPLQCASYVQRGAWIPVDTCNEEARGLSYRNHHAAALGTCAQPSQVAVWGWEPAPSASQCRVVSRDTKSLLATLNHRNVTFVGDSILRHIYHATCRQLGDKSAGAYNTSLTKWSDISKSYKNAAIDFRWAPLVGNLVEKIQAIQKDEDNPDLVIIGGGAWDRLHNYSTAAEQEQVDETVIILAREIRNLRTSGVPVVWVVPTTINSWALGTEQKRNNIREDQMAALRDLYVKRGVLDAASFVLDGRTFSADRVSESYDGVHYPLDVYDAGAQILANAFDWLLPEKFTADPFKPPRPGSMANPPHGLMILGFVIISLFLFDGFFGVSYLGGIFAPSVTPMRLYVEAFASLHHRAGLPPVEQDMELPLPWCGASNQQLADLSFKSKSSDRYQDNDELSDHELQSFLGHSAGQQSVNEPELRVV